MGMYSMDILTTKDGWIITSFMNPVECLIFHEGEWHKGVLFYYLTKIGEKTQAFVYASFNNGAYRVDADRVRVPEFEKSNDDEVVED